MTARQMCTLTPVEHRGGVVAELDIKTELDDGRATTITLFRWPVGWRVPLYLDLPPSLKRAALRVAREVVA
ncbi:hypothetical protein [Mycobacterium sp.]|uniref:hypothetical protein n=1 Tax=Mycobacterium sp. TaxID=1785 RepID=UPI002B86CA6D|nr:hypothetical protein [Mycobacterium sp.]HKP44439.1 hypothetical protein [Mycobacterium sp.]